MCLSNNALFWFVEPSAFNPYSNPVFSFIALYLSNHVAIIKVQDISQVDISLDS